jgi:glycosyltransferase involved in cell wall biosynthesis
MIDRVSVYIPCYNGEPYLKGCLEALLQQINPSDEIVAQSEALRRSRK